jgi:hypothetical protein
MNLADAIEAWEECVEEMSKQRSGWPTGPNLTLPVLSVSSVYDLRQSTASWIEVMH